MESQGVNNEKGPALCDFLVEAELQHYHDSIRNILKIQKTSQLKYATDEDLTQLGMSRPEQRRLKKFYSKHFPHNYFSKIKKFLGPGRREDTGVPFYGFMEDKSVDMQVIDSITKVPNKHIIPAENIVINKELGMGEFGVVQQGVWTNDGYRIQVAIKCLCRDRLQTNSMEFLKEAAIMHGIEHPSIVRLYGVVLHPDSLMLVTELAPLRSLLECLKEVSLRSSFPVVTLCDFAVQICNGMSYLEEKRLIHRDLAARNILVFTKNKVKISDFGLSRALGVGKDYYQTNFNVNLKLPIAWCAPECISYLRFTTASDVWAYAVTLWEMFSYGFQPWAAFSGHQILVAIDEPNFQRLEQPDCCPKDYYILMQKCWQHDPQKRPKFSEIATMLPDCKPVLVQVVALSKDADLKKPDQLNCRVGDTVTVLDKCNSELLWKGALPNGQTGYFNPSNTIAYLTALLPALVQGNVIRALPEGSFRRRSERNSFLNKRRLRSDMISAPQGDVKHTSHIGLDGACFGDVPFMDTSSAYNHVPRQVVNPYKPSEDLENQPLINPNSPSHCTGNTFNSLPSAYPIYGHQLIPNDIQPNSLPVDVEDESVYLGNDENNTTDKARTLSLKNLKINIDNSFNQIRGSKVKWPGKKGVKGASKYRQDQNTFYNNGNGGDIADSEFPHEYQEISESEKDNADIFNNQEQHSERMPPESPKTEKSLDFGQSLLDEMESMFRSLSGGSTRGMPPSPATLSLDHDGTNTCNELSEIPTRLNNTSLSRKKHSSVKPISAHDQRTLDCAIALANELTARSMNDLDHSDRIKTPNSPNERSKFHFKFPLVGGNHSNSNCHGDGQDSNGAKFERRNFSQEAQSVPDLQVLSSSMQSILYTRSNDINSPSILWQVPVRKECSVKLCIDKSKELLSKRVGLISNKDLDEMRYLRDELHALKQHSLDYDDHSQILRQNLDYYKYNLECNNTSESTLKRNNLKIINKYILIHNQISNHTNVAKNSVMAKNDNDMLMKIKEHSRQIDSTYNGLIQELSRKDSADDGTASFDLIETIDHSLSVAGLIPKDSSPEKNKPEYSPKFNTRNASMTPKSVNSPTKRYFVYSVLPTDGCVDDTQCDSKDISAKSPKHKADKETNAWNAGAVSLGYAEQANLQKQKNNQNNRSSPGSESVTLVKLPDGRLGHIELINGKKYIVPSNRNQTGFINISEQATNLTMSTTSIQSAYQYSCNSKSLLNETDYGRPRAMSFSDKTSNVNESNNVNCGMFPTRKVCSFKSIRARNLRRQSYNPGVYESSSDSDVSLDSVSHSEYDLRTKVNKSLQRNKYGSCSYTSRKNVNNKQPLTNGLHSKLSTSNSSIRSVPQNFIIGGNNSDTNKHSEGKADEWGQNDFPHVVNMVNENANSAYNNFYEHDEHIKYISSDGQNLSTNCQYLNSDANASAIGDHNNVAEQGTGKFNFDVTKLTGKSPPLTQAFLSSGSPPENQDACEKTEETYEWPPGLQAIVNNEYAARKRAEALKYHDRNNDIIALQEKLIAADNWSKIVAQRAAEMAENTSDSSESDSPFCFQNYEEQDFFAQFPPSPAP